jgi:hypothetical protein
MSQQAASWAIVGYVLGKTTLLPHGERGRAWPDWALKDFVASGIEVVI